MTDFVEIKFVYPDDTVVIAKASIGLSVLEVARQYKVPIEAACGGALSCATCHVILDSAFYEAIDKPTEDEENMLDLAYGLTPTSRLCCQIIVTRDMQGLTVRLPVEVNSAMLE